MSIDLFRVMLKHRRDCDEYAPRIRWSILERLVAEYDDMAARVSTEKEDASFDVVAQVQRSEGRGDVRREFARQIERSVL